MEQTELKSTFLDNEIDGVNLYCQRSDGKIIGVSRRHDHTSFGIPGGKVDEGETPILALIREIKEECGFTIKEEDVSLLYERRDSHNGKTFRTYIYDSTKEPEFEEGIHEENGGLAKWVSWDELITGDYGIYNYRLGIKIGRYLAQRWFIVYTVNNEFYNKLIDVHPFVYITTLGKKILKGENVRLVSYSPIDDEDYNTFKNHINNYARI
jgi:8-oxo-dGTP pyrophosphatase MutT (NUDIX family)